MLKFIQISSSNHFSPQHCSELLLSSIIRKLKTERYYNSSTNIHTIQGAPYVLATFQQSKTIEKWPKHMAHPVLKLHQNSVGAYKIIHIFFPL